MKNQKELTGYPHIDKPWMKWYGEIDEKEVAIPNINMVEYIKRLNEHRKNKIAYSYYKREKTYDELFYNTDVASKVLLQLGVKKGDRIMCLSPNIPEEEEIWFGATQIGAIVDYIDPRPDTEDIVANSNKVLALIRREKPKYIIALTQCYLGMIKPIENEIKELGIEDIVLLNSRDSMDLQAENEYYKDVINYDLLARGKQIIESFGNSIDLRTYRAVVQKIAEYEEEKKLIAEAKKTSPLRITDYKQLYKDCENSKLEIVNDVELVNYIGHTSGTSGALPKPIALTNKNAISSMIQCGISGFGPLEGDSSLHILPSYAPFGRYNNGIQTYANGGISIHVPEFMLSQVGYLVKKYHPNTIMGLPAFLLSFLTCEYLDKEDLSFIHRIFYGGDSMLFADENNLNKWLRIHKCYVNTQKGHGMSEYAGCGSHTQQPYNKPNSIGIPLPLTTYSIVNPDIDDKLVPLRFEENMERLRGELVVSSDTVTNGKLGDEVIVPHYEMDGKSYIRSRDLVEMDRDGVFYVLSRKDRSFPRFDGYKVKPFEIEKEIEKNGKVHYARITPYYETKRNGIMPMCHIVLNEDEFTEADELKIVEEIVYQQIVANSDMSSRQIPSKFKFRKSMPLTKNNKIDFNALANEQFDGTEISVDVQETNVSVGKIEIYYDKEIINEQNESTTRKLKREKEGL